MGNQHLAQALFGMVKNFTSNSRRKSRGQAVVPESLECRQLMTASMLGGVTPDGLWTYDTNGGGTADMDRRYGLSGDQYVVGRWAGSTQLGDLPAVARARGDGFLQWYLNTDSDVTPTHEVDFLFGLNGDSAVAGDWNGDGLTDVGVVRKDLSGGLTWYLDLDRDPEAEIVQSFGLHGDIPVVGDWDNNGTANVGVVRSTNTGFLEWHLDVTGDAWPEVSRIFGLVGDKPVVGDWDDNGRVDLGVARVSKSSPGQYEWHRDINGDPLGDLPVVTFGSVSSKPMVGRWMVSEVSVSVSTGGNQVAVVDGQAGANAVSFGRVLVGDEAQRTFTIKNTGTRDLALADLSAPSGFAIVGTLPGRLAPGQEAQFTVRVDTSSARQLEGSISFTTNDGNESPFNFVITCVVETRRAEISVSGTGSFGSVSQNSGGGYQERTLVVTNRGTIPLTFQATSDNPQFSIVSGASEVVIPQGGTTSIVVRMQTTTTGTKQGILSIVSNATDPNHRVWTLNLSGTVTTSEGNETISLSGNTQFGTISQNSESFVEREFIVTNTGSAPYTYTATLSNDSFVFVSGRSATVPANGGSARIIIRMPATTIGNKSAVFKLGSIVTKTLSGQVVATPPGQPEANVVINSTTLAPGKSGLMYYAASSIPVRTQTFVIRNTGTGTLRVTNPVIVGEFTHNMPRDFSIAAGESRTITVWMQSTVSGTKIGRLNFTTNDSDEGSIRINLLGRKLDPVTTAQGTATNLLDGIYTIYHSGSATIYIDPSHGRTPANGLYAISTGGSKLAFNSSLRKVVIVSSTRPNVENWTNNITVEWKHSSGTTVLPHVRSRLDLFQQV